MSIKKPLVIIRGLPGSGKSTLASKVLASYAKESKVAKVFEADQFFINDQGEYKFDGSKRGAAHAACQKSTEESIQDSTVDCVVVSNTSLTWKEINVYLDMADENKEFIDCVYIVTCSYPGKNIHGVGPEKLEQMKKKMVSVNNLPNLPYTKTWGGIFVYAQRQDQFEALL